LAINLIAQDEYVEELKPERKISVKFPLILVLASFSFFVLLLGGLYIYLGISNKKVSSEVAQIEAKSKEYGNFENEIRNLSAKTEIINRSSVEHIRMSNLLSHIAASTPKNSIIIKGMNLDDRQQKIVLTGYVNSLEVEIAKDYVALINEYRYPKDNGANLFGNVELKSFNLNYAENRVDFEINATFDKNRAYQNG